MVPSHCFSQPLGQASLTVAVLCADYGSPILASRFATYDLYPKGCLFRLGVQVPSSAIHKEFE